MMREHFTAIARFASRLMQGGEIFIANFRGEDSTFCRFNHGRIRQLGEVKQQQLHLRLINGKKQSSVQLDLSGEQEDDFRRVTAVVKQMRDMLPFLPDDPFILYATDVTSTEQGQASRLPASEECLNDILTVTKGLDLVGILTRGTVYRGFANSLGQENWYDNHSFHFDFSLYHETDKAAKSGYAGFDWRPLDLAKVVEKANAHLQVLAQPTRSLVPGKYRAYLSPHAIKEFFELLNWSSFSIRQQKTKASALLKMVEEGATLSPLFSLSEEIATGLAPNFNEAGYIRPPSIPLVTRGKLASSLISARSAKEYDVPPNGANQNEMCESLSLTGGTLAEEDVLRTLDTGLYISNLWYLNFSDMETCRMTGMTRFATFWVEHGRIKAPCPVMRFDESLYRLFGTNLLDLTKTPVLLPSADTYEQRSLTSYRVPGALVQDFALTL